MIDPRIMARELIVAHNGLCHFVGEMLDNRQYDVLHQVYSDLMVHGAKLVRSMEQWDAIPEKMGWNAPNFCR